jgi:hypothetical protein
MRIPRLSNNDPHYFPPKNSMRPPLVLALFTAEAASGGLESSQGDAGFPDGLRRRFNKTDGAGGHASSMLLDDGAELEVPRGARYWFDPLEQAI